MRKDFFTTSSRNLNSPLKLLLVKKLFFFLRSEFSEKGTDLTISMPKNISAFCSICLLSVEKLDSITIKVSFLISMLTFFLTRFFSLFYFPF